MANIYKSVRYLSFVQQINKAFSFVFAYSCGGQMDRIKKVDDEEFDYEAYFSLCFAGVLIDKGYNEVKKECLNNNGNCSGCGCKIEENSAFCVEAKYEIRSEWVYPKFRIYCEKCSWGE